MLPFVINSICLSSGISRARRVKKIWIIKWHNDNKKSSKHKDSWIRSLKQKTFSAIRLILMLNCYCLAICFLCFFICVFAQANKGMLLLSMSYPLLWHLQNDTEWVICGAWIKWFVVASSVVTFQIFELIPIVNKNFPFHPLLLNLYTKKSKRIRRRNKFVVWLPSKFNFEMKTFFFYSLPTSWLR